MADRPICWNMDDIRRHYGRKEDDLIYTVQYLRDGENVTHDNLTKMEADLLASYIRRTFRKEVIVCLQNKANFSVKVGLNPRVGG